VGLPEMLRLGDEDSEAQAKARVYEVIDRALWCPGGAWFLELRSPVSPMPDADFAAEFSRGRRQGRNRWHVFYFPILSNGTVSLNGVRRAANRNAKGEVSQYLFGAHNAARTPFSRSRS
jgi:hypothetical protein